MKMKMMMMMMHPNKIVPVSHAVDVGVTLLEPLLYRRVRAPERDDDGTKKRREERDVVDDGVEEDVEKA